MLIIWVFFIAISSATAATHTVNVSCNDGFDLDGNGSFEVRVNTRSKTIAAGDTLNINYFDCDQSFSASYSGQEAAHSTEFCGSFSPTPPTGTGLTSPISFVYTAGTSPTGGKTTDYCDDDAGDHGDHVQYMGTLSPQLGIIVTGMTADTTKPLLLSSSPADEATGVAVNSNIILTFDEAVNAISGSDINIYNSDNILFETIDVASGQVTGTGSTTITVNPTGDLASNTGYYVLIAPSAFEDAAGNSYSGIQTLTGLNFTTADVANPALVITAPQDNETSVAINSNIVLTFDEAVDVETGNITIKKTSDDSTIETIDVTSGQVTGTGSNTITINPTSDLAAGTEYYINISTTAFDDPSNNSYAGISSATALSFTTAATLPTLQSSSPVDDATGVAVNTNIVLTFSNAMDFNTGNITIKKTSDDSTVEAIDVTTAQVTVAGTTITVNPASDLANLTEYYVLIDSTAFLDDSTSAPYAGISSTTALSFTTVAADTTNPILQSSTPSDDATGVAVNTNIVLTFDEAVNVETGNITIKKTSDDSTIEAIDVTSGQVTGTGSNTITINPTSDLVGGTEYYVLIDAPAFDDAASNSYAGIASATELSFITVFDVLPNPLDDKRVVGLIQAQTQTAARVATQALGTVNGRLSQLISASNDNEKTANNSYQGIKLVMNLDPNVDSAIAQTGLLSGLNSSGDIFHNGWAVWTEGSVILGKNEGRSDFHIDGITIGVDKRITPSFTAGLALRAAQEDNDVGVTEKVDTDAYSATAYGSYVLNNNSYLQGAIGYSDIELSTKRVDDTGSLSGDRDADQVYMSLSFTREFDYKGFTLLPYGSFDGSYSTLDSYSETGTGTALTYHEQDVRTLAATVGLRGRYFIQQSNGSLVPRFHINYKGALDSDDDAKVSYVSVPSTIYSSSFDAISSSAWLFGLGFDYQYNNLNFSADYERTQEINWGYSDAFKLKLEATF